MEKPIFKKSRKSSQQKVVKRFNKEINCLFIIDKQFLLLVCIIAEIFLIKVRLSPLAKGEKKKKILCFVSRKILLYLSCTFRMRFFSAFYHNINMYPYMRTHTKCLCGELSMPFYVTLNLKLWVLITATWSYGSVNAWTLVKVRTRWVVQYSVCLLHFTGNFEEK